MLSGYAHAPGDHCGSASLRNLASFYDWDLTEAQCFGLGAGVGFGYADRGPASRTIMGRNADLEPAFLDHLAIDATHEAEQGEEAAWDALQARIDTGDPVMCFVDLYYLDYFGTSTHFGPHTVLVVDIEGDSITISDSEFPEPQTVSRAAFDAAWSSEFGFGPLDRRWLAIDDPAIERDLVDATREAVADAAAGMLDGREGWGGEGVAAIRAFADDLPDWNDLEDPCWTARFAYQNVERRGTGGGCFRRLYADFLGVGGDAPAASFDSSFAERAHDLAGEWTALGGVLKEASETDDEVARAALFGDAGERAHDIADAEERLFSALRDAA